MNQPNWALGTLKPLKYICSGVERMYVNTYGVRGGGCPDVYLLFEWTNQDMRGCCASLCIRRVSHRGPLGSFLAPSSSSLQSKTSIDSSIMVYSAVFGQLDSAWPREDLRQTDEVAAHLLESSGRWLDSTGLNQETTAALCSSDWSWWQCITNSSLTACSMWSPMTWVALSQRV